MSGRHVRTLTPQQARQERRLAAQRLFNQVGLPRGLRVVR